MAVKTKKALGLVSFKCGFVVSLQWCTQRFKVAFIREIWLTVRETRRFVLYPGNFRIIRENFVEFFRFVGEQIGFQVLVFGPAGAGIEPGRCTFLSILVFRIFF